MQQKDYFVLDRKTALGILCLSLKWAIYTDL
jgi:hypothetical protein